MLHQEFIAKWNNQYQERRDPKNRNQCFDLIVGYAIDVLGLPEDTFAGILFAADIWNKPTQSTGTKFDFIKNNSWAIPRRGDIMVFSGEYNAYTEYGVRKLGVGHTVVIDTATINSFTAFSQNDPTGSPCIMKNYNYDHVLGWIRHITHSAAAEEVERLKQQIADLQETEKRLKMEKEKALSDKENEFKTILAESAFKCQQEKKEVVEKIRIYLTTV